MRFRCAAFIGSILTSVLACRGTVPLASLPSEREARTLATELTFSELPTFSEQELAQGRLGRKLFFDARLSRDGQTACATCHVPSLAFSDGLPRPAGRSAITRNTLALTNLFSATWFFWDGRADSLAAQAIEPLVNPHEHGLTRREIARIVRGSYAKEFAAAFGPWPDAVDSAIAQPDSARMTRLDWEPRAVDRLLYTLPKNLYRSYIDEARRTKQPARRLFLASHLGPLSHLHDSSGPGDAVINRVVANVGVAIAQFERGLVANDSAFDRFASRLKGTSGDVRQALGDGFGEAELAGLQLFAGEAKCILCHSGPNFTDQQFHNVGLPDQGELLDTGRTAGIRLAKLSDLNCRGGILQPTKSESCRELPWLDELSLQHISAFKTPSLRNVGLTAPYGHDGRFPTLRAVLEHYNKLDTRSLIGMREATLRPLGFSETKLDYLEAFLRSLSSPVQDTIGNQG